NLIYILGVVIPTEAGLYGYGQVGGFYHGFGHRRHFIDVLQQTGPRTATGHILYGATVIDVDQIGARLRGDFGSFTHGIDVAAENLYTDRALVFEDIQLLPALSSITYKPLGRDKLRIHHIHPRSEERRVGKERRTR